jgi:hypothetical protein
VVLGLWNDYKFDEVGNAGFFVGIAHGGLYWDSLLVGLTK